VDFIYPENGIKALNCISFKVKSGQILGITGPVGCGKSSIITALTRQYDVNGGEILIDGKNLKEHDLKVVRDHMGIVTQDVFLFSDTIANNISFGSKGKKISREKIEEAAEKAGVHENIQLFPDKYETRVGERGVTLSGGQKQRISIARALVSDPNILLFDDYLSAVDTETEEKILGNLKSEMNGKTAIIISHRISSIIRADKILYIKDGKVTEEGSHEELMNLKKDYYQLYCLQSN